MSGDEREHGSPRATGGDLGGSDGSRRAALALTARPEHTEERAMANHGLMGRMAYRASYGLAFGLVYPVAMVARMVPRENALVHGLRDGAVAAREEAFGLGDRSAGSSGADMIIQPS